MPTGPTPIRLVLADVDGTLVTPDKELTDAAVGAVERLHDAGVHFAVTSGRPPRGMAMLVEPLRLTTPVAAFNGGLFVDAEMKVLSQHTIPDEAVAKVLGLFESRRLDTWLYRGDEWLIRDRGAPHVEREAATVKFSATIVPSFDDVLAAAERADAGLAKIVGVSDDHDLLADVEAETRDTVGEHVCAARSQPYYLDVTHPLANKGRVVEYLCSTLEVSAQSVCTLGDMPNDVLMFARSGMSIAMGNADCEVQRAARHVTRPNTADGFAYAIERFVLPAAGAGPAAR